MRYLPRGNAGVRGVVVLAIIVLGAIARGMSSGDVNSEIRRACADINAKCPEQFGPYVQMDSVTAGDKRVTYNFSFKVKIDKSPEELKEAMDEMKTEIVADVKKDSDTQVLLNKGVTLAFKFSDNSGKLLTQFDVAPNR